MSDHANVRAGRRGVRRSEPKALLKFIEELSWLLTTYDDLDFRALGALADQLFDAQRVTSSFRSHIANRAPTTQQLVGIIPSLLTDEKLFPSNEGIVEFSTLALGITIPRWHKKSKFELIGHIVCSTEQADPKRVQQVVLALRNIMDDRGETRQNMEVQRKSGMSWNEVIQKLLETEP